LRESKCFHLRRIDTNDVDGAADQFLPAAFDRRIGAPDVLAKEDLRAADLLHFEADDEQIVESCRLQVFDADAANDEGDPRIAQQIGLLVADLAQPFGAAALEETSDNWRSTRRHRHRCLRSKCEQGW
jgi:hypothetical protein